MLLIEIPFKIRALAAEGYSHFRLDTVKSDPKRIQLKAWKEVEYRKNFECESCGKRCNNSKALQLHAMTHAKAITA